MSEWISVEERLPETLDQVLAAHLYAYSAPDAAVSWHDKDKKEWHAELSGLKQGGWSTDIQLDFEPTHWMPLPEPPQK